MPFTRARCQKCGRRFQRLDTHLRVSATCREVRRCPSAPASVASRPPMNILSAINSNSAVTPHSTRTESAVPTSRKPTSRPSPSTKASLTLPTTAEDWEQADLYFQSTLVPDVLSRTSPQQMSSVLCEGIYSYFASRYGIRTITTRRMKERPPHNRALKEVEKKKKEDKRDLRLARKRGSSADVVQ